MPALRFSDADQGLSASDDARLSRVEASLPRSLYGGNVYSPSAVTVPSSSAVLPDGRISPSTGVAATGNTFPFVVQGQFNFTWDGFALIIYWDGTNGSQPFVVRRADGSQFSVPRGSLKISSLAANTTYSFAPFSSVAQPETVAFCLGDAGSPRFALSPSASGDLLSQAAQTQRLVTNERLTDGLITFKTGTAGTQTTGGGSSPPPSPYTGNDYQNAEQSRVY